MANANLTQALAALDGQWKSFADGVAHGSYSLWLGSAISRDRFPPLQELLHLFLVKLYGLRQPLDPNCGCRRRLREILALVDSVGLDPDIHPDAWEPATRAAFLSRLAQRYSVVLDDKVMSAGVQLDPRWDILELPKLYANRAVSPDAEHRFLALLIEEGAANVLVTTNWDALIEAAFAACHRTGGAGLHVVACNDELAAPGNGVVATLYKIHGCALKTEADAVKYRGFMMATESEIRRWNDLQEFAPLREAARTILRERPAAFVGLSIQDVNLEQQLNHAGIERDPPPRDPPRVLFTVEALTDAQKRGIRAIYTDDVYWVERDQIERVAAVPLYAKPLLGGLYVRTIFEKLKALISAGAGQMTNEHLDLIKQFLSAVSIALRSRYDSIADASDRWRQLADGVPAQLALFLRLYRKQTGLATGTDYEPICSQSCGALAADANIALLEYHWVLLGLALLWKGASRGLWNLVAQDDTSGRGGQFQIERTGKQRRLFVVMQGQSAMARLSNNGLVDLARPDDVALLYPTEREPRSRGSMPGRALPSGAPASPTEIWLPDLLAGSPRIDDILREMSIALV